MPTVNKKKWYGTKPVKCQVCNEPFKLVFFDAALRSGHWGLICASCFHEVGIGLGTGLGQMYNLKTLEKIA